MFQVMIVDDELSVLEGIALTTPWDSLDVDEVYRAQSGDEALELLKLHSIDIVITDIRMPGMSGLELIQTIQEKWKGTKCIILSGHAEFQYAQEAIRLQTTDYLLKPIRTEELVETVRNVQQKLRKEWDDISSHRQAKALLHEHRPLLCSNLLNDLLAGRYMSETQLEKKMRVLDIPFFKGDECAVMIIRMEGQFGGMEIDDNYLFEFAVNNITEEIYGKYFKLWSFKDVHDFLVIVLKCDMDSIKALLRQEEMNERGKQRLIERLATQLQKNVQAYLKGRISLMISNWGCFPEDLRPLYELSITTMRKRIGNDPSFFFTMGDEKPSGSMQTFEQLYKPPTFMQLLEAGRWERAAEKIEAIFCEVQDKFGDSREYLFEAFHHICTAFSNAAHQNGQSLVSMLGREYEFVEGAGMRSPQQLKHWSLRVLQVFREDMAEDVANARTTVLEQVKQYVEKHLAEDVSLVALADYVHRHPVYLSKVFKLETGETLSDYLYRERIERAVYLLRKTDQKIYEIAKQVGYENTYFMKVFKKHFGKTPQEFRENGIDEV